MVMDPKRLLVGVIAALLVTSNAYSQDFPVSEKPATIEITSDGDVMVFKSGDGSTHEMIVGNATPKSATSGGAVQNRMAGGFTYGPGGMVQATSIDQIRQRAMDSLKEALGCSDAEWAVVLPKLEKIQILASNAGEPIGMIGPVVKSTSTGAASNVALARQSLHQSLQNPTASEVEIKQKTDALREAKARAREALAKARQDLVEILTQRQEAVLIDRRILE